MDENKINPIPANEPEVEQIVPADEVKVEENAEVSEEVAEEVTADEVTVAENAEESEVVAEDEPADEVAVKENAEESEEFAEEATADEVENETTEETPAPKKKKSKGAVALLVILVALLLAATAFFVSVIVKSTAGSRIDHEEIAVTVGEDEITVGEYLYWFAYVDAYYYNYYSYYYSQIPESQIKDDTLNQLSHTSALYNQAVKAGYTLSEEDKAQIDENMNAYTQAAEASSVPVDDYVAKNFGKGYTLDMLRTYLEKQAVAYKYYEDMLTGIQDDFKASGVEDNVEKAYKANKVTYDLANVTYCYFDATDENAQKNANTVIAKVKDGMSFADAVKAVTGDDEAISDSLSGLSKEAITANFNKEAADWIFETDAEDAYVNGKDALKSVEAGGVVYVLYVNDAPARNSFIPVSIDYVKITPSSDDSIKSAAELKLQAKSKATSLFAEFEKTGKSAEDFAKFEEDANADVSGLVKAFTYEDTLADGSHDAEVEKWMSEEGRKEGDYALVEGKDGAYYIVYMMGISEKPVWYQSVYNSLLEAELKAWEDEFIASYEDKIVADEEVINNAVAAFKQIAAQNAG